MSLLKILTYPNNKLTEQTTDVRLGKLDHVQKLADKMFEVMKFFEGVGLAAPQVGVSLRLITIDFRDGETPEYVMINPVILEQNKEEQEIEETCLSFPLLSASIQRPKTIKVKYLDYHGKEQVLEASGKLAARIQHEIDHLNGKLFTSRMSSLKRGLLEGKMKKKKKKLAKIGL